MYMYMYMFSTRRQSASRLGVRKHQVSLECLFCDVEGQFSGSTCM
jgi:hypothetical protein